MERNDPRSQPGTAEAVRGTLSPGGHYVWTGIVPVNVLNAALRRQGEA
jgi:hypothetical protein